MFDVQGPEFVAGGVVVRALTRVVLVDSTVDGRTAVAAEIAAQQHDYTQKHGNLHGVCKVQRLSEGRRRSIGAGRGDALSSWSHASLPSAAHACA